MKGTWKMEVEGRRPRGRLCKCWIENIREDMKSKGLSASDRPPTSLTWLAMAWKKKMLLLLLLLMMMMMMTPTKFCVPHIFFKIVVNAEDSKRSMKGGGEGRGDSRVTKENFNFLSFSEIRSHTKIWETLLVPFCQTQCFELLHQPSLVVSGVWTSEQKIDPHSGPTTSCYRSHECEDIFRSLY